MIRFPHSIRGRLTVFLLLSLGLLFLVSGGVLYSLIHAQLVSEFDRTLLDKAKTLMTLTEEDKGQVEIDIADKVMPEFAAHAALIEEPDNRSMPEFGQKEHAEYFMLWLASGALIARSPSLGDHELPRQPVLSQTPVLQNIVLPYGQSGRLIEIAFVPRLDQDIEDSPDPGASLMTQNADTTRDSRRFPEDAAVLLLARDRQALDALLRKLQWSFAGVILGLLGTMVMVVRSALQAGLRPLDEVRRQVDHLDARSLAGGIQLQTQALELMPVVTQLNALLNRLEAAFTRERQFSSDVAHELRTPLAELRTLTEVGMRWPEDTRAVMQYFADTHAISLHMERIVQSLLTLARCESGRLPVHPQLLALGDLVETSWNMRARLAQEKRLTWHCAMPPQQSITADYDILQTIFSNLFDNAINYSPPGSTIFCSAIDAGEALVWTLQNLAEGLTQDDIAHVFERFWRKDPARTGGDHTGLGLAIVQALAELLDLEAHAYLDAQSYFTITLTFQKMHTLQIQHVS